MMVSWIHLICLLKSALRDIIFLVEFSSFWMPLVGLIEFFSFTFSVLLFFYSFHYKLESSNQTITPQGLLISQLPVDAQLGIL